MKKWFVLILAVVAAMGCARVRVEGSKEPIKVDVSMRLDVYQHVEKDIDQIENMINSPSKAAKPQGQQSFLKNFVTEAYAEDGLGEEVSQAAMRRKDRRPDLVGLEQNGVVGENASGMVVIKKADQADSTAEALIKAENEDRMIIYQSIAAKNGTSVEEVEKIYAKRLQADAPSGTPIEVMDSTGSLVWQNK